jgi:hypothetical protein
MTSLDTRVHLGGLASADDLGFRLLALADTERHYRVPHPRRMEICAAISTDILHSFARVLVIQASRGC